MLVFILYIFYVIFNFVMWVVMAQIVEEFISYTINLAADNLVTSSDLTNGRVSKLMHMPFLLF